MDTMIQQCTDMMRMMHGAMMNGGMTGNMMNGSPLRGMLSTMMWPMLLGLALLAAFVILGIVIAARLLSSRGGHRRAVGILQERFARGEIDQEEYQACRRMIEQS
jgi:uncharacterized membrane protein